MSRNLMYSNFCHVLRILEKKIWHKMKSKKLSKKPKKL